MKPSPGGIPKIWPFLPTFCPYLCSAEPVSLLIIQVASVFATKSWTLQQGASNHMNTSLPYSEATRSEPGGAEQGTVASPPPEISRNNEPATPEESPISVSAPASLADRLVSLDVLRGVALLGILVMNIDGFGTVSLAHSVPIGSPTHDFSGPHVQLTLWLLMVKWMFFEGKMRGLFSMLFGAGVILLTSRAELRGNRDGADIFTRRNLYLMGFGLLHSIFIWRGDILFDYGFYALLFLYPMRKLSAKTLVIAGTIISIGIAPLGVVHLLGAEHDLSLSRDSAKITQLEAANQPITTEQKSILAQWKARMDEHQVAPEVTQARLRKATAGYPQQVEASAAQMLDHFTTHLLFLPDGLSAMLIGMGLMKLGFFNGKLPDSVYWRTAIIGFLLSVPFYFVGVREVFRDHFFFLDLEKWLYFPYYLTREPGYLAIAATVMLVVRSGRWKRLQSLLGAVGRTAFSNYLLTSVICQTLFLWGPWKLFGRLDYLQLMYVVICIWAFNIVFSVLWLKRFAFGPFEYVWRALTYGYLPPLRLPRQTPSSQQS
jgi:uncharacterized protein